jgi:hypothetical protein
MAIQFGSLRHSPSGRKRKPLPKSKGYTPKFEPLQESTAYRRDTKEYKSVADTKVVEQIVDTSYRAEVSAKYTLAPAYNKGAYQVISRDNVKDIGR